MTRKKKKPQTKTHIHREIKNLQQDKQLLEKELTETREKLIALHEQVGQYDEAAAIKGVLDSDGCPRRI